MRWLLRVSVLLLLFVLAVVAVQAQTGGYIRGTVVDGDGNTLEGVKVEASSASAGSRSTTTGKDGVFRFPMIPTGNYKVRFTLESHADVEKNALVRLDATTTVNAKLFKL